MGLSVEVISLYVGGDLCFPLVSIVEKLLLVVQQLLVSLRGELKVWALELERQHQIHIMYTYAYIHTHTHSSHLHNGVHRTRLLAEAAVDAFGHVDVVTGRPPAAVGTSLRLNGDGLRGGVE